MAATRGSVGTSTGLANGGSGAAGGASETAVQTGGTTRSSPSVASTSGRPDLAPWNAAGNGAPPRGGGNVGATGTGSGIYGRTYGPRPSLARSGEPNGGASAGRSTSAAGGRPVTVAALTVAGPQRAAGTVGGRGDGVAQSVTDVDPAEAAPAPADAARGGRAPIAGTRGASVSGPLPDDGDLPPGTAEDAAAAATRGRPTSTAPSASTAAPSPTVGLSSAAPGMAAISRTLATYTPAAVLRWAISVAQRLPESSGGRDFHPLGASIYSFLTGRAPTDAAARLAALARNLRDPLQAPSDLRKDIPASLDRLTVKLLALDSTRGFASATEALRALQAVQAECGDDPRHAHARSSGTVPWSDAQIPSHLIRHADADGTRALMAGWMSAAPALLRRARPIGAGVLIVAVWFMAGHDLPTVETSVDVVALLTLAWLAWRLRGVLPNAHPRD